MTLKEKDYLKLVCSELVATGNWTNINPKDVLDLLEENQELYQDVEDLRCEIGDLRDML